MATHILSLAYDPSLLQTRQLLLESEGYLVISAMRLEEAISLCKSEPFDLVVMGHCVPEKDSQQFIRALHSTCSTPILALRHQNEIPDAAADYNFDVSTGPEQFAAVVKRIVSGRAKAA